MMTNKLDVAELYGALALYGMAGCAIRLGLASLVGFEYGGILWVNVCGSFIMGFHTHYLPSKMHIHWGVGLCGSITSFSTLMVDAFKYSTTRQSSWNNGGYGLMAYLAYVIVETACSVGALKCGHHFGILCGRKPLNLRDNYWLYRATPVLAAAGWIACLVCACAVSSGRLWTLMLTFAPSGVWLRYWLSRFNTPTWRWGTLSANVLGTLLVGVFTILQNKAVGLNPLQIVVLAALADGVSGNLSTVSSFVNELNTLPLKLAYSYYLLTIVPCTVIIFLILGPFMWINGSNYP